MRVNTNHCNKCLCGLEKNYFLGKQQQSVQTARRVYPTIPCNAARGLITDNCRSLYLTELSVRACEKNHCLSALEKPQQ